MKVLITKAMVDVFADLVDDHNPIHVDDDFAANTKFGRCIVHGPLVVGLIGSKMARDFEKPVLKDIDLKFVKPIMVGDTIEIEFSNERIDGNTKLFDIVVTCEAAVTVTGTGQLVFRKK